MENIIFSTMKTRIGIDPGSKGYMTVMHGKDIFTFALKDESALETFVRLKALKATADEDGISAVMEEVHAIFGASAKSTFNFGEVFGLLKGLLIAADIPYTLVPPKTWQSEIWINDDKVYRYKRDGKKMVDTKNTSINAARRLFPDIDLRRNERCRNIDDNLADSLLICEYGRRKNL
jgi:hypothetical protein